MHWTAIILLFSVTLARLQGHGQGVNSNGGTNTFRAVAYYVNWAIYDRNFYPQELPADKLTHVMYAFANVKPDTGEVYLSDQWADVEIHFPSDNGNESGNNLYGCLKQLYLLKKQNRHLKVLLSIGGSLHSPNFVTPASTASGRSTFASSAVSLVKRLGFDGIDIDWEYPADNTQASNMVQLLQSVREELDACGQTLNPVYHFTLTVACPASPSTYQKLHVADMDQYLDFWNFIAYDYAGNWSTVTANQANLFLSTIDSTSTPFDTQTGIDYYISKGIPANKIVLGMPVYGRSFNATKGLGMPFSGVGQGTWEVGVYDFKSLPLSGSTEFFDGKTGSSYSYDATKRELISYDTIVAAKQKALWIKQIGLGGAMWWESSADKLGDLSLIQSVVQIFRGNGSTLENTSNELSYPDSIYDNLRAGMPDSHPALSGSSSCSGGAHLSPSISRLIATSSPSSTTLFLSSPCTKASLFSTSWPGTVMSTIPSTSTSVTRCITVSTSASLLNNSGSLNTTRSLIYPASQIKSYISISSSTVAITTSRSTTTTLTPLVETSTSVSSLVSKETDAPKLGCTTGGTCRTYNCVACPGGSCFCGVTSSGEPACFHDESCHLECSTIDDCGPGEGCLVDSCCGATGHCITIAKDPSWCANTGNSRRDHGGGWQAIWQGSASCQAFH